MPEKETAILGGEFLIADLEPGGMVTPEQFNEEQVMMARTAEAFVDQEVLPRLDEMESGDHGVTVELLRAAGKLGLLGADVAEEYGGLGLDKVTNGRITEKMARGASFAASFGTHVSIGTLPIVFFGNQSQKSSYLPRLATGEMLASYALTEPDAGSDALGGKTIARLGDDGQTFLLNGEKQWITNSGFADLFVLYAKVDGEQMTAFLVERNSPGLTVGPEFKKMGLLGSSTCSVYLKDVPVPAENVLGEVGRGHIIAFNALNIGRWKLAAGCLGSCKAVLETSARYARERRQFGKPIAEFPAIQQKLAQMAARTFALESVVYRTAGLFDHALASAGADGAVDAIGEYVVEASINKVLGSEVLDFVVDEGVQIHGGYGYMREFAVERAYRDARINRIFEGTNEVNRLLITRTLLRRALKERLPLLQAIQRVQGELSSPTPTGANVSPAGASENGGALTGEMTELSNLKRATVMLAGLGSQKYLNRVEEEQEYLMAVADLAILVYSWESMLLRARQLHEQSGGQATEAAVDMAKLYGEWALAEAEITAKRALAGMEQGDTLQDQLSILRKLFRQTPVNTVELGRRIARRVLDANGQLVNR